MKGKVFVDTNFLVYLFSTGEPDKRDHCQRLFSQMKNRHHFVWSTQIIQEFYQVMTSKHGKESGAVKSTIEYFREFELVTNNLDTINYAIDIHRLNKITFWDSLVISAARQSKCKTLLSEDLTHGQEIHGLKIQNPFMT